MSLCDRIACALAADRPGRPVLEDRVMSCFRVVVGVLLTTFLSTAAFAQSARAVGTVKDTSGRPIKGATVRAANRDASPSQITVEAPGFTPVQASAPVRVAATPPMGFALARDPGPIPGALDKNVLQSVTAANALRDRGQYDQALAAYQQIREQNPKLTSVTFVVAGMYRKQAASETDPAARRALLDRAVDTYTQLLNDDALTVRAKAELESTRSELQALPR